MKSSKMGIDLIKKYEGCRLKAYKPVPTEKHWTIGFGHCGPDVRVGQTITQAQAEELLKEDLKRFEDGVNKAVKVELNQNQFDALVSFSYNCGVGALQTSTLLELVNKRQFTVAADQFDLWNKAGGNVLPGLVRRRKEEKELFAKSLPKPPSKKYYLKTGSFDKVKAEQFAQELKQKYGWIIHVLEVE